MSSVVSKIVVFLKPKRRWFQYSLRTLLIIVTLVVIGFGPWAYRSNRQRQAVEAIAASGGELCYSYQAQPSPSGIGSSYNHQVEPPWPRWLRSLLGDDYFITPVYLMIRGRDEIDSDCLAHLDALPHLQSMWFYDVKLRDEDIANLKHLKKLRTLSFGKGTLSGIDSPEPFDFLKQLRKLESLSLSDSEFGNRDAANLAGIVTLGRLYLYDSAIGDGGLVHLQHLINLEKLGLGGTNVTDGGIAHVSHLQKLRYLSLSNTDITDSAIEHFSKMSGLRELELYRSKFTESGLRKLRKALPKCKINGERGLGARSTSRVRNPPTRDGGRAESPQGSDDLTPSRQ